MRVPTATYRLQLNSSFGFKNTRQIIPYLHRLGISDIYASPVFKASKGSTHGYDIVDPNELNPELGTEEDFTEMMVERQKYQIGWLQDIVPNHMAFNSENQMLMDVFENGKQSRFFDFFDIVWDHPDSTLAGKVMVPFLGSFYDAAIEDNKIRLGLSEKGFYIQYYEYYLPLCLSSYSYILKNKVVKSNNGRGNQKNSIENLHKLGNQFDSLTKQSYDENRNSQVQKIKQKLWNLYKEDSHFKDSIEKILNFYNGKNERKNKYEPLRNLLNKQNFRLSLWKKASEQINYRRFFYLNEFIGLKVEKAEVFDYIHRLIINLIRDGKFTGLRIDHVDGLYDPTLYLYHLREKLADTYIVIEKILESHEKLLLRWPIQGTTGYEFTNRVNELFCRTENKKAFSKIYRRFTGLEKNYDRLLYDKKKLIIRKYMTGDIRYLTHVLKKIDGLKNTIQNTGTRDIEYAFIEIIASFPVYRTYINSDTLMDADRDNIEKAISLATSRNPRLKTTIETIGRYLVCENHLLEEKLDKQHILHFIMKFQQMTAPSMAKGFEDTFLYCYNRLISLNEVGSRPDNFGIKLEEFHRFNFDRLKSWRYSLNTTGTHDTKRGEDVRARINVLSEIPEQWNSKLNNWSRINKLKKTKYKKHLAPDGNDEYFLYQTLIGALPFRESEYETFRERVKKYFIKAIREAKVHTSWIEPDEEYERACEQFVDKLLVYDEENEFWKDFISFQKQTALYAVYNSLSQVLIKLTSPGIPDFYQGSELWDLNLVDPDNRHPVDFVERENLLTEIQKKENLEKSGFFKKLFKHINDGRIKMFLIYKVLSARKKYKQIFEDGSYLPLTAIGRKKENIIAYARKFEGKISVTVAPRFITTITNSPEIPIEKKLWEDTAIVIPDNISYSWKNLITGYKIENTTKLIAARVLDKFPVALLFGE